MNVMDLPTSSFQSLFIFSTRIGVFCEVLFLSLSSLTWDVFPYAVSCPVLLAHIELLLSACLCLCSSLILSFSYWYFLISSLTRSIAYVSNVALFQLFFGGQIINLVLIVRHVLILSLGGLSRKIVSSISVRGRGGEGEKMYEV